MVKDRLVFGRNPDNDIPLYSFDKARHHGLFVKEGDDYFIEDTSDKRFPVLVNNAPILARTLLKDGDVVTVFRVRLLYRKEKRAETES